MTPRRRLSPGVAALLTRLFTLLAYLLMALSAFCFRWTPKETLLPLGAGFMLVGGAALLLALYLNRHPSVLADHPTEAHFTHPTDALFALGLLTLALLIEIESDFLHISALEGIPLSLQLIFLIMTITLLTLGLGGFRLPRGRGFRLSLRPQAWHIALVAIIALAFVVRYYRLGTAVHKFVDEINFSSAVMTLKLGAELPKLLAPFSSIAAFPWLYPYLQSWFVYFGGRNLESLRLLSVIMGTLGIPALYLLAKTLFDRPTALIAALLLATFPPHIQFSRIGLNNIADPLFGTLAIAFLARGLKHGRRMDFALAGASLGLTQYFYEGGRFLFPVLVLVWLVWYVLFNRLSIAPDQVRPLLSPQRNRLAPIFSTFFLTAFLVALPIYTTLLTGAYAFDVRFQTVGVGGSYWFRVAQFGVVQTLEQQILRPLLIYVNLPETALYYGGEQGLILPFLVVFFLLGLFWLLWRWCSLSIVLLFWLLLTSLGNMVLTDSAISARYVVAFPALMLIVAVGLRYIPPLLVAKRQSLASASQPPVPHRPSLKLRTMYLALSTVIVLFAAVQLAYYFGPHLQTYNAQVRRGFDGEDAIFRAAALPFVTNVQIISDTAPPEAYLSGVAGYLADGLIVHVLPKITVTPDYIHNLNSNFNYAFFVEPEDRQTLSLLHQTFALLGPYRSPYDGDPKRQLLLYYAPAGAKRSTTTR